MSLPTFPFEYLKQAIHVAEMEEPALLSRTMREQKDRYDSHDHAKGLLLVTNRLIQMSNQLRFEQ